jgi:DNA repair exonuclease SbcCD ATPase subunit
MKKINFKKLFIQNFLSIGSEPVEIDFHSGMNVITGINRDENDIANAAGKSSVSDAFYFALFGNTMRELSKLSFIVNRKVGKNCCVRLEADIETPSGKETYLIERKLAPQSLKLWKNGTEVTKSTTAETNKYIEELFHADKDIFQNCVLMRANNSIPFMGRKKQEKKNFIETIFNLNIFSMMSRLLKEDMREIKSQYSLEKNALDLHESNIASYRSELGRLCELQEQYDARREKEVATINEKIKNEKNRVDELQRSITQIPSNSNQSRSDLLTILGNKEKSRQEMLKIKSQLSINEGILRRDLSKLQSDTGICPTCQREYSEEHKERVNSEISELNIKLQDIVAKLSFLNNKLSEEENGIETVKESINKFDENAHLLRDIQSKINESLRIIGLYEEQLKAKNDSYDISGIENFKKLIESTEQTLSEVKKNVENLEKELGKMNICEHILGEYGVRAYIVNKLLDLFNNRIMYYLSAIKSTFSFRFNEYFEEEIKDSNGVICLYNNCSGAEMKKIDLAISFAINDMLSLQHQISYNVIFFDEILDSSLDDKSLNIVLNFISEHCYKENKSVYIISHKSGAQIPFINEVITLEKINGFTKQIIS